MVPPISKGESLLICTQNLISEDSLLRITAVLAATAVPDSLNQAVWGVIKNNLRTRLVVDVKHMI